MGEKLELTTLDGTKVEVALHAALEEIAKVLDGRTPFVTSTLAISLCRASSCISAAVETCSTCTRFPAAEASLSSFSVAASAAASSRHSTAQDAAPMPARAACWSRRAAAQRRLRVAHIASPHRQPVYRAWFCGEWRASAVRLFPRCL